MLSACMITRDEASNLPRCLDSIKGVADEIVLVDTGSTDATVEIAERYGAVIHSHPWKNDFSLHRNQSLAYATGDWLLSIDADEELCGDVKQLKPWLEKLPADCNGVSLTMLDMQDGKPAMEFNNSRVFRRGKVRYVHAVHNYPEVEGKTVLFPESVFLKHYGYDITEEQRQAKFKRTWSLLQERLQKNPEDFQVYFYLSQMHAQTGELEKAISSAEKYIEHEHDVEPFNEVVFYSLVELCLTVGDMERADKWLGAAMERLPGDLDTAMALLKFGLAIKRQDFIFQGAGSFVQAYDAFEKTRLSLKNRFVYNHNPESLTFALFHLTCLHLQHGITFTERLRETLQETSEAFREMAERDIEREFERIGVKEKSNAL